MTSDGDGDFEGAAVIVALKRGSRGIELLLRPYGPDHGGPGSMVLGPTTDGGERYERLRQAAHKVVDDLFDDPTGFTLKPAFARILKAQRPWER